jgi:hypothetical protein
MRTTVRALAGTLHIANAAAPRRILKAGAHIASQRMSD